MRSRPRITGKSDFPSSRRKLLDAYYKFKGWDNEGIPTKESLKELDLAFIAEDFEQRGITKMGKVKKKIKVIKIDVDKCNGCRACEVICSAFHATPKYSSNNPARSRIRLIREPLRDVYLPVYAGENTSAECMGRDKYVIDGKEYEECDFCRASCPSRDVFKEPDSGLPLKCDMCESDPPLVRAHVCSVVPE